jgi:L-fucose isomerase-like protein
MKKQKTSTLLGLCPIGKFVFSHEDALRYKALVVERLEKMGIRTVNLDGVIPDGVVRDQKHVEAVVRHFRDRQVDALFIPHCNFGTEGAAGMIAHGCGIPTLLWGPRDEAPLADGSRLRDSLCGTLATSKVLHTMGVRFSYIPNCRIDDPEWKHGVDRFLRAARVAKAMRTMKIGFLGQRIDFFWSTIVNEAELLSRFGVQIQPLDLTNALREIRQLSQKRSAEYESELQQFESWINFNHFKQRSDIYQNFAFRDWLLASAEENSFDAFAVQSIASIQNELNISPCLAFALAEDAGYPVAPESDLHGAISSALIEAASARHEPAFLPDITIRHPNDDDAVLLWHAHAALSLRRADSPVKLDVPWILKGFSTGLLHMRLKDGPITLCRFDGGHGEYRIGAGEGHTIDGPYTQEFYVWLKVNNWPAWERQLIRGPYIHHCSCVYDHCADVLAEFTRFIPGLTFERFGEPTFQLP